MGRLLPLLAAASVLVVLSFLRFGQGVKGTTKRKHDFGVQKQRLAPFSFCFSMDDEGHCFYFF